jgi:aldehyde dehydrogenase (NAD+)
MTGEVRMLIDGELRGSGSGATFENVNPATEEVLGVVADATADDMDAAIAGARRAFDAEVWSRDLDLRLHCLEQLQTALEEERELLRAEIVAEVGAPVLLTYGPQLDAPLTDALRWPTERARDYPWQRRIADGSAFGPSKRIVTKVPVGVVGAIAPWNYPFEIALAKLGPALVTGNTVVLKPAPDTPWSATRIGRLIAERTDIPAGVVNVVTSSDHARGEQLVLDPRVDMISFTGSTATGRRIMAQGAPSLKRLFLELGGKSAQIYLDDADLTSALSMAAFSVCAHGGQGCAMPTRMLLPRSRYDEGVEIVAEAFRKLSYGDPTDAANLQGPQINRAQRDKILGMIDQGVAEGARLVVGGGRPAHLDKGWYVEPTVFADVDNSMSIARQEIFGPVLAVIPFDDDEDAVRIANDSEYGLSGMVSSADLERALGVAHRIRSGTMTVNGGQWYGAEAPFGGFKASGIGRQNGEEGLEQYLETRTLGMPLD